MRRRTSVRSGWTVGVTVAAMFVAPAAPRAHAAPPLVFTVDDTADVADANPGDGTCDATGTAGCTLRAAVDEVNARDSGDTIAIAPGIHTLAGGGSNEDANAAGDLDVLVPVTIRGTADGVVVDGLGQGRVLDLHADGAVTIEDVTIRNGRGDTGAGVRASPDTALVLRRVDVRGNEARPAGPGATNATGGGVQVGTSLTVVDSLFRDNIAVGFDGGTATGGAIGGFAALGQLDVTIRGSTFEDNQVGEYPANGWATGAAVGIAANQTDLTVSDSTFVRNDVNGRDGNALGGGLMAAGTGTLTVDVTGSSVEDGVLEASGDNVVRGGGIYLRGADADVHLDDVTIAGNTLRKNPSSGGPFGGPELEADGGGLWIQADSGAVAVTDSTVADNTATSPGALESDGSPARGGGIALVGLGAVDFVIRDVELTGNSARGGGASPFGPPPCDFTAGDGLGGGLDAQLTATATLLVEGSLIRDNDVTGGSTSGACQSATGRGGGIHVSGSGQTDLQATVTGNRAVSGSVAGSSCSDSQGGGIHYSGTSPVHVRDSLVADNVATGPDGMECGARGGGIHAPSYAGPMELLRSVVARNTAEATGSATARGGGLDVHAIDVEQSLIRDNVARSGPDGGAGLGGGLRMGVGHVTNTSILANHVDGVGSEHGHGVQTDADVTIRYSTIADNSPRTPSSAAGVDVSAGTLTLAATILDGHGTTCSSSGGTFATLGANVADDGTGCDLGSGDLAPADPMLAATPDEDLHTSVPMIGPDSPAADLDPDCSLGGSVVAHDQIGDPRPVDADGDGDADCDAGAHEWRPSLRIEAPAHGVEGGTAPTVRISLVEEDPAPSGAPRTSAVAATPIEVALALTGSATSGTDYTVPDVVIPAGQSSTTVVFTPVDDGAMEGMETIRVNLAPGPHTQVGPGRTLNLLDNDVAAGRLAGDSRIETAVEVSQSAFSSADTVVIARADQYPDALAGAPLAHRLGAPILLTRTSELPEAVADEIARLGATAAVVLGGEAAVSTTVAEAVAAAGAADVERIAGADRFETAARIAAEVAAGQSPAPDVYVAEGANANPARGWPDALSVSPVAAYTARPILLVVADRVPDATADALDDLGPSAATIVGGEAAVSTGVEQAIRATGVDVDRVSGPDRYGTSVAVADAGVDAGLDPTRLWFATGLNWPDALVAGSVVADDGGVMLLVHGSNPAGSPPTLDWLTTRAGFAARVTVLGGVGAVAPEVVSAIEQALTPP